MVESLNPPRRMLQWIGGLVSFHLEEVRLSVFRYIETFYNSERIHETLNYLSPDAYEAENAPVLAEAQKQRIAIEPLDDRQIEAVLDRAYAIPKDIHDRAAAFLAPKN